MPLDPTIQTRLDTLIGKLPATFRPLATIWSSAAVGLISDQANATLEAVVAKLTGVTPTNLDALHDKMTQEELNAESKALEPVTQALTQKSYDAQQLGRDLIAGLLRTCLGFAIASVFP